MHATALRALAAAGAALLAGVAARAQPAALPPVEARKFAPAALDMRAAEWQVAGRAHVSGEFDGPAESIARWPTDLTRVVVDRAIRQAGARRALGQVADDRTILATGLILHTDIALAERTTETGTARGARAWTLLDATPLAATRFSIHWGLAGRLATALAKDPAAAPIARGWYRAVGALHQQWADLGQLHAHLSDADGVFPNDPVLLLYEGTLHQGYADARVQAYIVAQRNRQRRATERVVTSFWIGDTTTELRNAERTLRRALALDPSLHEARIRLAHVQDARGRFAEAAALAREALAAPLPAFLEYYGAMVLGRTEVRLGRHAEARAAFARAAARYPGAQSAQVALSHVALLEGRAAEGVDVAARALGPQPESSGAIDPWEWYFRLHDPDAKRLLAELRSQAGGLP